MWYDVGMLVIVAFTTIHGAAKGMAWQLAAIAALVLCFLFATPLSLVVAPAIPLDPPLNRWVAMLGIYLAFSFGCFAGARMFRSWLEAAKFEEYDRHLGALFGFLKGATICLVISFFTVCLSEASRQYVLHTRSGRLAGQVLDQLALVMPAELDAVLAPDLRRFDEPPGNATQLAADGSAMEPGDRAADDESGAEFRGSHRTGENPFDEPNAETGELADQGRRRTTGDGLEDAVGAIGEKVREGVKTLVRDALTPTPDAPERSDLERPEPDPHSAARVTAENLHKLTAAISHLLSASPQKQTERREEIEALLQGIPISTAAAALRDWQADLLGAPTDPDPETDASASLDLRLARQLRAAGTAIEDLPRPLRNRLLEAESE
ncbi:MAG TPA: CvpA family protein [Planctomycetaceae bacterium]|nr:CvpA family protein [Planctomycetaceae bacterium]